MKLSSILFVLFFAVQTGAFAQKSGLINSGELIKEGSTLYDSSAYKKALVVFDKINRSDTNYVFALYHKAVTCQADSQYTLGIKYCQEGLALKEQREYEPDLYNTYGNILSASKQYDQAIKIFDEAIVKYPRYALLYFNKAIVMSQQERWHEAELLFQQALLINPYLYSAHYQLAVAAVQQGKIIPSFLSCLAYLLMSPEGKYFSNSINTLSAISKSTDDVLAVKNKRKEAPDANYQMVEEIVLSKIALDKGYKPLTALDDILARQIQVVFEKLEFDDKNSDFYTQYYLPYFKQVYKDGKFEAFINHAFSNATNVAMIQDYNKKHKKELEIFVNQAADYFNVIRATNQLILSRRDTVSQRYEFDSGRLVGKGILTNNGKTLLGHWEFYYPAGNLKGVGNYNQAGMREGEWRFYRENGKLKSTEHYLNGKLQGSQDFYYDNGNLSSHEVEVDDKLEGFITTYYYSGAKKTEVAYKQGKKEGEEKLYFDNGLLKATNTYVAGVLTGPAKSYYKSGGIKQSGQYVNDKTEGPYKSYYETGGVSAEMQLVKEKVEGEWKSYYESGKLKEKRNYINDEEDGLHQEYYESGQVSYSYTGYICIGGF